MFQAWKVLENNKGHGIFTTALRNAVPVMVAVFTSFTNLLSSLDILFWWPSCLFSVLYCLKNRMFNVKYAMLIRHEFSFFLVMENQC